MTSPAVATFMANLFPPTPRKTFRLLDPGAGNGALARAFLARWRQGGFSFEGGEVWAYEVDADLHVDLYRALEHAREPHKVTINAVLDDFVHVGSQMHRRGETPFSHAILNPPYKKISSESLHRLLLRSAGIETVNLYSAFVALSLALLEDGGYLVAIIPRSFCNGPYYRPFREFILRQSAIRHMHLFHSRSQPFKADAVLQENVILMLEKSGKQKPVTVTTSTDDSFGDLVTNVHEFDQIVRFGDPQQFIHVPTTATRHPIDRSLSIQHSLAELGLTVSTGPVVDFRVSTYLRDMPVPGSAPLLYPGHFQNGQLQWPKPDGRKPNSLCRNRETEKWLYPTGYYCVVRRFSSKEERRRVVPGVVEPALLHDSPVVAFENHLNVFHEGRRGLPETLARGLAVFLSTTAVDEEFRRFNGHTQVNATDLRLMRYPSREALDELGRWAMSGAVPTQAAIDARFGEIL